MPIKTARWALHIVNMGGRRRTIVKWTETTRWCCRHVLFLGPTPTWSSQWVKRFLSSWLTILLGQYHHSMHMQGIERWITNLASRMHVLASWDDNVSSFKIIHSLNISSKNNKRRDQKGRCFLRYFRLLIYYPASRWPKGVTNVVCHAGPTLKLWQKDHAGYLNWWRHSAEMACLNQEVSTVCLSRIHVKPASSPPRRENPWWILPSHHLRGWERPSSTPSHFAFSDDVKQGTLKTLTPSKETWTYVWVMSCILCIN